MMKQKADQTTKPWGKMVLGNMRKVDKNSNRWNQIVGKLSTAVSRYYITPTITKSINFFMIN